MATVKRFEDLEVWQQARKLATAIYQLTSNGTI
ncbi:MAG TPA: four helix bundle protein, partial [Chitinophagaceae bacterium]|nr:four helix bundle protein [Chitinophagaceae bacterium]